MSEMSNNPNLLDQTRLLWLYNCINVFYMTVYHNKSTLELVVIQKDGVERQILARQCSQDSQGLQANNAAIATGKGPYIIHLGPNSSPE
jgi:hypothetical protein